MSCLKLRYDKLVKSLVGGSYFWYGSYFVYFWYGKYHKQSTDVSVCLPEDAIEED